MEAAVNFSSLENSSSEQNWTHDDADEDWTLLLTQKISVPITFAVIFIVGILGNAILVITVVLNKAMRTPPNVLIVNMALGDFVLLLISVPVASTIYTLDRWEFGNAVCKVNEFLQTLSLGVSIFTLVALSVDRFVAIVYPLTSYSSRSVSRVVVASVLIWVASVGLGLMDLVGSHAGECTNCEPIMTVCFPYPADRSPNYIKIRIIFRFVVFFAVPMMIIVIIYALIAFVLLRQSKVLTSVINEGSSPPTPQSPSVSFGVSSRRGYEAAGVLRQIESRKKIAKVVLSFVVIFVLCWLPRHVYVMHFNLTGLAYNLYWHVFKIIGFCLMFIYSAVNPLALYFLNDEYRRYYRHYLCGWWYAPWRLRYDRRWSGTPVERGVLQTIVTSVRPNDVINSKQKCQNSAGEDQI